MCGSSHKAIRYRCEMQSIVSPTPCIIDSSFDGSGILEEGNIHFCIHSIAKREAVQKATACIAWGGRAITEQRASVKFPWPRRFVDDNSEVVSDIGEAYFWRLSFCVFLQDLLLFFAFVFQHQDANMEYDDSIFWNIEAWCNRCSRECIEFRCKLHVRMSTLIHYSLLEREHSLFSFLCLISKQFDLLRWIN